MDNKICFPDEKSEIVESVKIGTVAAINGSGDVVKAVVDTIARALATVIRDTGQMGASLTEAISLIVRGAIHGVAEIGSDVGVVAEGIILGILRGTKETGAQAMDTISHTSSAVIMSTVEIGGVWWTPLSRQKSGSRSLRSGPCLSTGAEASKRPHAAPRREPHAACLARYTAAGVRYPSAWCGRTSL